MRTRDYDDGAWNERMPAAVFLSPRDIRHDHWMHAVPSWTVQQLDQRPSVYTVSSGNIPPYRWSQRQWRLLSMHTRHIRRSGGYVCGGVHLVPSRNLQPTERSHLQRCLPTVSCRDIRHRDWGYSSVAVRELLRWLLRRIGCIDIVRAVRRRAL